MNKRLGTLIAALCLVAAAQVTFAASPTPAPKPPPVACPAWKRCPPVVPQQCGPVSTPCRMPNPTGTGSPR